MKTTIAILAMSLRIATAHAGADCAAARANETAAKTKCSDAKDACKKKKCSIEEQAEAVNLCQDATRAEIVRKTACR